MPTELEPPELERRRRPRITTVTWLLLAAFIVALSSVIRRGDWSDVAFIAIIAVVAFVVSRRQARRSRH